MTETYDFLLKELMEIDAEIKRIRELYKHYKKLYRRLSFICCNSDQKLIRRQKNDYKRELRSLKAKKLVKVSTAKDFKVIP